MPTKTMPKPAAKAKPRPAAYKAPPATARKPTKASAKTTAEILDDLPVAIPIKKARGARGGQQIVVPLLDLRMLTIFLYGDTPLIVHAWSKKAKEQMLRKQQKEPEAAQEPKDPVRDFEDSMYRLPDGGFGFPSRAFKAATVTACTSVAGVTKIGARQAFHVMGETVDIQGAFPGTQMRENLARIMGCLKPNMREDMVRIGQGVADLRYRAEFWPWWTTLTIRYNSGVLSPAQIMNLANVAGFGVGVGEWRPDKSGENGMFHAAFPDEIEEIKRWAKEHGQ